MASRSTRVGGRNPEQAGQAAWLATEKVVRALIRQMSTLAFTVGRVSVTTQNCVMTQRNNVQA